MSVTLTRGFSEYYTTLLQALRDDIPNINVYCYNGHMTISGLLLASVRNFVQMNKNFNSIIAIATQEQSLQLRPLQELRNLEARRSVTLGGLE